MNAIPSPNRLFVYGTLRQGGGNHPLLSDTPFIGRGLVTGTLKLSGWLPVADNNKENQIVGEVYEVTEPERWRRLDGLEGHPRWYCREVADVQMEDGTSVQAWIYWMPNTTADTIVPSGDYMAHRLEKRGY